MERRKETLRELGDLAESFSPSKGKPTQLCTVLSCVGLFPPFILTATLNQMAIPFPTTQRELRNWRVRLLGSVPKHFAPELGKREGRWNRIRQEKKQDR